MTLAEVIAEIQAGIGFRSDKVDEIKRKLVLAQQELERGRTLPSFIIIEDEPVSLSANTGTWALPSNFIREVDDFGSPLVTNNDVLTLKKVPYDSGFAQWGSAEAGTPLAYSRRRASLQFWPNTDTDLEFTISYYAKQDNPATASTNAWSENAPGLLIGLAGMMIAQNLRDPEAKQDFATTYALASKSVFNEIVAGEDANMQYSLGGML